MSAFKKYTIKGKFTDRVYGGIPADPEKVEAFLTVKGMLPDDIESADRMIRKSQELNTFEGRERNVTNIFPNDENGLYLNDYQLIGAIKDALYVQKSITNFRVKIQRGVRVNPRKIYLYKNNEYVKKADGIEQNVTHAEYMGRPVSSLTKTAYIEQPEFKFSYLVAKERGKPIIDNEVMRGILDHIEVTGIGARRSLGNGRSVLEIVSDE